MTNIRTYFAPVQRTPSKTKTPVREGGNIRNYYTPTRIIKARKLLNESRARTKVRANAATKIQTAFRKQRMYYNPFNKLNTNTTTTIAKMLSPKDRRAFVNATRPRSNVEKRLAEEEAIKRRHRTNARRMLYKTVNAMQIPKKHPNTLVPLITGVRKALMLLSKGGQITYRSGTNENNEYNPGKSGRNNKFDEKVRNNLVKIYKEAMKLYLTPYNKLNGELLREYREAYNMNANKNLSNNTNLRKAILHWHYGSGSMNRNNRSTYWLHIKNKDGKTTKIHLNDMEV